MEFNLVENTIKTNKPNAKSKENTRQGVRLEYKRDSFESSKKLNKQISFTGKTPWGFVDTINSEAIDKVTGKIKTSFYDITRPIYNKLINLFSENPQKISFKDLCKILAANDEEFYIDEEGCLQLAKDIIARKEVALVKFDQDCKAMEYARESLQELFKKYGINDVLEKDYDKIISQVRELKRKIFFNDDDIRVFENAYESLKKSVQNIQKTDKKLINLEQSAVLNSYSTLKEAREGFFKISDFLVDKERKLCKIYSQNAGFNDASEIILTYPDVEKYLNLIKNYDFIDQNINISVIEKEGKKYLKFSEFSESSYHAIHTMHRLIERFGKKEDGSIDFDELKKVLDKINDSIKFPIIPNNWPRKTGFTASAGVYLPWGTTSYKNTSLIVPYNNKYDFINAVFNSDGKLVTIKGASETDVRKNMVLFDYNRQ